MDADGFVPAVDPKAANDPLLKEVAKIASELKQFACGLSLTGHVDADQLVQLEVFLSDCRSSLPLDLLRLKSRCWPGAAGTSHWPATLPRLLSFLVQEARRLVERETPLQPETERALASELFDVAWRLEQAGTDPVSACKKPWPGDFFEAQIAEIERRNSEWQLLRYQSVFDPVAKRSELIDSSGIVPDPIPISSEAEITADYRSGGIVEGEPLSVDFLSLPEQYNLSGSYLSKNYKGHRLKLGKKLFYLHREIAFLSDKKNRLQSK